MTNKILIAIEAVLGVSAIILLLISMFGNIASNLPLTGALACIAVSGVINVINIVRNRNRNRA